MARRSDPDIQGVYPAAERWVNEALRRNGSLFSPDRSVWTVGNLDDLYERFVEGADHGNDSFEHKLARQLQDASTEVVQLMAELAYVHLLIAAPSTMKGDTKRQLLKEISSASTESIVVPEDLATALDVGPTGMGTGFNMHRPSYLRFLLEFARIFKGRSQSEREELLVDPWLFKRFVYSIDASGAYGQRDALLHLVFPEAFEDITSQDVKQKIADAFLNEVRTATDDVDLQILEIREALTGEYPEGFSFYDPEIQCRWDADQQKWDQLIEHVRGVYLGDRDGYEREEISYKLAIEDRMRRAREELIADREWVSVLKEAFTKDTNLTSWRAHMPFLEWCESDPDGASEALRDLWSTDAHLVERIRRFSSRLPAGVGGPGNRTSIVSVLLAAFGMEEYPPYRADPIGKAIALTGFPSLPKGADEADRYLHALALFDCVVRNAAQRGVDLERGRLDAQSLLWVVVNTEDDQASGGGTDPDGAPSIAEQEVDLSSLADELLIDVAALDEIVELLADKRQMIFYGPPGTGKTYVAQKLAGQIAAGGGVELVQFHPSYAYEDFVEGLRPRVEEDQTGFWLRPGPLKRLTQQAVSNPDATYVLIIDEINRGNVAKVFGELYFLLEYRDHSISLQYSDTPFALPENLWIIGTMNTADRSISLLDAALRRRFHFYPFFPSEPPIEGLLGRWLEDNHPQYLWLADIVDLANELLEDRDGAIGPSHFLRDDLDETWIERIWKYSVLPTIAERYYGQEERLDEFSLDRLRAKLQSGEELVDTEEGDDGSDHA